MSQERPLLPINCKCIARLLKKPVLCDNFLLFNVQDEGSFPLLVHEWGAIEEVLLLDAVEQDGFGNW